MYRIVRCTASQPADESARDNIPPARRRSGASRAAPGPCAQVGRAAEHPESAAKPRTSSSGETLPSESRYWRSTAPVEVSVSNSPSRKTSHVGSFAPQRETSTGRPSSSTHRRWALVGVGRRPSEQPVRRRAMVRMSIDLQVTTAHGRAVVARPCCPSLTNTWHHTWHRVCC